MSVVLDSLLLYIRQHEGFEEFKALVEYPRIQPFKVSDAERPETARSRFIYQSGQVAQQEAWLAALIGNETSQQENQ